MTKKTHLCAGITAGLVCNVTAPMMIMIGVGSLLPDIDIKNSTISQKIPIINHLFQHRGFTHSLIFLGLMFLINPYLGLGVATHIILDMLNPSGVQLFFPSRARPRIPIIKTGSFAENIFFGVLLTITIAFLFFNLFSLNYHHVYYEFWKTLAYAKENILDFFYFIKKLFSN